jgi:hypothetical protein
MKKAWLLLFTQVWALTVLAQDQPVKNSIRFGADFMTLDAPDASGLRYQARYAKHILSDRILIATSLGYFRKDSRQNLYRDIYTAGNSRRRVTGDLSLLADLLASPQSALRIGGGISAWYRRDNIWTGSNFLIGNDGSISNLTTTRYRLNEWNTGYHLMLEFEQRVANNVAISGKVGWASLQEASTSVQVGIGVSYLFE